MLSNVINMLFIYLLNRLMKFLDKNDTLNPKMNLVDKEEFLGRRRYKLRGEGHHVVDTIGGAAHLRHHIEGGV